MTCDVTNISDRAQDCIWQGYTDQLQEVQLGMLLAVCVAAPLYVKYEDPIIPAIALTLLGGTLWPILPGFLNTVAWTIVFFGLTMGVFTAMYRSVIS